MVKTLQSQLEGADRESGPQISHQLSEVARKDQELQNMAAALEALNEEKSRWEYVINMGPHVEGQLKQTTEALHAALCADFRDAAAHYYGHSMALPQASNPRLIQLATVMKKAVSGDAFQVSSFVKTLSSWKLMLNKCAHTEKAYMQYAEKAFFDSMKPALDHASQNLDQFLHLLRAPRERVDRQNFLRSIAERLMNE